jgi:uncharacterized glyoxalase superfamily protein PhnB
MTEQAPDRTFSSSVVYKDHRKALAWLEAAFAFEVSMVVTDDKGEIAHAEMRFGDGSINVAQEWSDITKSPSAVGGHNTQQVNVRIDADIDAHCERARKAGARIVQEPGDQFYGDRTYRCQDPEGHVWNFRQAVKAVSIAEMEKASGLKIRTA